MRNVKTSSPRTNADRSYDRDHRTLRTTAGGRTQVAGRQSGLLQAVLLSSFLSSLQLQSFLPTSPPLIHSHYTSQAPWVMSGPSGRRTPHANRPYRPTSTQPWENQASSQWTPQTQASGYQMPPSTRYGGPSPSGPQRDWSMDSLNLQMNGLRIQRAQTAFRAPQGPFAPPSQFAGPTGNPSSAFPGFGGRPSRGAPVPTAPQPQQAPESRPPSQPRPSGTSSRSSSSGSNVRAQMASSQEDDASIAERAKQDAAADVNPWQLGPAAFKAKHYYESDYYKKVYLKKYWLQFKAAFGGYRTRPTLRDRGWSDAQAKFDAGYKETATVPEFKRPTIMDNEGEPYNEAEFGLYRKLLGAYETAFARSFTKLKDAETETMAKERNNSTLWLRHPASQAGIDWMKREISVRRNDMRVECSRETLQMIPLPASSEHWRTVWQDHFVSGSRVVIDQSFPIPMPERDEAAHQRRAPVAIRNNYPPPMRGPQKPKRS